MAKKWKLLLAVCFVAGTVGVVAYQIYATFYADTGVAAAQGGDGAPPEPPMETPLHGHSDGVLSLAFSPDGKTLASGSGDTTIILWDIDTLKARKTLKGHPSQVTSLAFSPDGKWLASGSVDHSIVVWNLATHDIEEMHTQRCPVNRIAFLPDHQHFVTGCGNDLRVWKLGQTETVRVCTSRVDITAIAVTRKGEVLTGDMGGNLIAWDPLAQSILQLHRRPRADQPLKSPSDVDNRISGIVERADGSALVSDRTGIWAWDRKADKLVLVGKIALSITGMLPGDRRYTALGGNSWAVGEADSGGVYVGARVENAHAIAPAPGGRYVAIGGGGAFSTTSRAWTPGGASPVTLASVAEIERSIARIRDGMAQNEEARAKYAIDPTNPPLPWE